MPESTSNETLAPFDDESFEKLLNAMQNGEDWAWAEFFNTHYGKLIQLVRRKMDSSPLPMAYGGSDAAQDGLKSFFRYIKSTDRSTLDLQENKKLWNLLVAITNRKLSNARRAMLTKKRGGDNVRTESTFEQTDENPLSPLEQGRKPFYTSPDESMPPDVSAIIRETTEKLMLQLSGDLRIVFQLMCEGYTQDEIAEKLGLEPSSIKRIIALIRKLLEKERDKIYE